MNRIRQTDMPGQDLLLRLLEILNTIRQRTQFFIDLLDRERQAIKTLAMDRLASVNATKLRLIEELSLDEDVRADLVRRLAVVWNVPPDSMTIGRIADRAGGTIAVQLKQQQSQLNHVILAAKRSNQITGAVLHKSLAFLHEAVSMIRAPLHAQLSLYSDSGSIQASTLEGGLIERRG